MRLIVLPLVLSLLLVSACKDAGSGADNATAPAIAPTVAAPSGSPSLASETAKLIPSAAPESARQPEVRIAGEALAAGTPPPKRQDLLPLARILSIARGRVPGEIIDVDLDDDDGLAAYEVEILTAAGRKIEIRIDARRGTVLDVEED